MKTLFFFPGIVLSAGWTVLNIIKIISYIDAQKSEYPECTQSNPNRLAIFIPTIIALMIVKNPIETCSIDIFMRVLNTEKFPEGSELR
jgi:hypothetical protein